jgi:hypothetical protein
MKGILLLPIVVLLLGTGCNQSNSSSPTTSSTNSDNSGSVMQAPANYLGGLQRAEQNAGKTADVASLNQATGLFQVDKGRFPKDLNELVTEKYVAKIPEAPYGMKIDYDPATGQVKVVKQ